MYDLNIVCTFMYDIVHLLVYAWLKVFFSFRNLILWDTLMPTNRGIVRGRTNFLQNLRSPSSSQYSSCYATSVCLCLSVSLSLSLLSSPHRLHVSRWWCNIARLLPFKAETNLWREKRRGVYLWHPTVLSSPSASSSQLLSQLYRCEWHRWLFRHWSSWWGDKGYILIM